MKKKILAVFIIAMMLSALAPQAALAATHTVADGETLNIGTGVLTHADSTTETLTISEDDIINVDAGAEATITGSKNVRIDCGAGVTLTLDGVTSDNFLPLIFTGGGNTLTLVGANTLTGRAPGVRVQAGTSLEITGDGSLEATGGLNSAGIGGGSESSAGAITITGDVDITAKGGHGGAGIGGGYIGDGGTITITDNACVTAMGGGRYEGDYGDIYGGAGIGGGDGGDGGTINISGGVVYAVRGAGCDYDIGRGINGSDGTINVSGGAAVFLGTDTISPSPVTSTHTHYEFTEDTEDAYGIPVPAAWEPTFGAYLVLCDLAYHKNGGDGTPPSPVTDRASGTSVTVADGSGLSLDGFGFGGWNTAEDGSGEPYAPGDDFIFTGDTTLYAQWEPFYTLDYDKNGGEGTPPPPLTQQSGANTTVEANPFTYDAHEFACWNTAADGSGTAYAPGDTFTFTGDTTLYAQWGSLYMLRYNANGGRGTPPPTETESTDSGVTETVIKNAKGLRYAGHVFDGWNTAANGSGTAYDAGDDFTYTGVTTLYAQWKTPVKWVSLDSTSKTLALNETADLDATVSPKGAANAGLTWKSSDESIVTVDGTGIITAKGFGSATVSAEADGHFDTCTVMVVKTDVTGVGLSSTSRTMGIGDTATLRATVSPGGATHPDVMWKSTDASVATVSQSGRVTAVAEGAAAITAEADGQFAVCAVLVSSESDGDTDPSPASTATASPQPTGETGDTPGTGDTPPTPTEQTAETIIITIVMSDLPEGTAAIQLPNGEIVELDGSGAMRIEVDASDIGDDGSVELIALDEEGIPLGTSTVIAEDMQAVDADTGGGVWRVLLWVFIGLAGIGGAGATVYLLWRKGQRV